MRSSFLAAVLLLLLLATGRSAADDKKLGDIVPPKEISGKNLKEWVKEIKNADPGVIENAIRTVLHFGTEAREAGPNLIWCMDHPDSSIRTNAAVALGTLNKELNSDDIPKAVKKLGEHLTTVDSQTVVKFHCALALSRFGSDARPAIGELIIGSQNGSCWEIRKASVVALGSVAGEKKPAEPRVYAALHDVLVNEKCAQVRLEAAVAIAILGRPASNADALSLARALEAKFADRDKGVAIWSRVAYMAVDEITETQLKEIAKYTKDPSVQVRGYAIKALGTVGAKAEAHIPELIDRLRDKEGVVAATAATALTQMDKEKMDKDNQEDKKIPRITARLKKEAVPVIYERLKDKDLDEGLQRSMRAALELLGEKPADKAGK